LTPQNVTGGNRATQLAHTITFPYYQGQIDEIRSLGSPAEGKGVVTSLLDSMQRVVDEGRKHPAAFARSLAKGNDLFPEASRVAKRYGFAVCGRGFGVSPP